MRDIVDNIVISSYGHTSSDMLVMLDCVDDFLIFKLQMWHTSCLLADFNHHKFQWLKFGLLSLKQVLVTSNILKDKMESYVETKFMPFCKE